MKPSFYFVLWQLAWLPANLLDIPFLNEYGFIVACAIVFLTDYVVKKVLKTQIEDQQISDAIVLMELAYNNDYKKYKRQTLFSMIVTMAMFIYMLLFFIALFTIDTDVPIFDYIIWGAFTIGMGIYAYGNIKYYIRVVKDGHIVLDENLQDIFQDYKEERGTCTYEDILSGRPKSYHVMNTANIIFAIVSILIGLLVNIILYTYRGETNGELVSLSLIIYGVLAFYFGIKDLLSTNTSISAKCSILILSCVLVTLIYSPLTNILNKDILNAYIANDPSLKYDVNSNLVQGKLDLDGNLTDYELPFLKKRLILTTLSGEEDKKMLKKIIRVNAEFHVILKDISGETQIVKITPNELTEIYNQDKSDLDILLELLRLDYGNLEKNCSVKVYADGEYITIELQYDNISYPIQSKLTESSTALAEDVKGAAEYYDVASFNRGLKIRIFFENHQFIEQSLSLKELRNIEKNANNKSDETSNELINIPINN